MTKFEEEARAHYGCRATDDMHSPPTLVHAGDCRLYLRDDFGCVALTALLLKVAREQDLVWSAAITHLPIQQMSVVLKLVNDPEFATKVHAAVKKFRDERGPAIRGEE